MKRLFCVVLFLCLAFLSAQAEELPEVEDAPQVAAVTAEVREETWEGRALERPADGAPIARVYGKLTLRGCTIDGAPASQADLLGCFALEEGAVLLVEEGQALQLSAAALCLNEDDEYELSLTWQGEKLKAKRADWSSSDKEVARVSKGVVKARDEGRAVVTAEYEGAKALCAVLVVDHEPVKEVRLDRSEAKLALRGTLQLTVEVRPEDAWDPALTWTTSDSSVATVDEQGLVTAVSGGRATITAAAGNGKSDSCTVSVEEIKAERVDLTQLFITLNPGDTFQTVAAFTPASVSDPALDYVSSDPQVAQVDASGLITATGAGKATITATSKANAAVWNTCQVCVIEPGSERMAGLVIGVNPGHQRHTIKEQYPLAPGSSETAYGVKEGACGKFTGVPEYETTLQIGLKLARDLTEQGATVVITRTSNDVQLTNIDRAQMLNEAGVDVALQLHCNSVDNSNKQGNSGYIRTTGDWVEESYAISDCITRSITQVTGMKNLGVKINNNYMSLNWTTTPSVLLEMGYLSNREEDELLATDAFREKLAYAITEGLCEYFGR